MAFFEKGLHLGARKEEGSRYDKDTLKREKGNQERKGAVAVRTTGRAGGGRAFQYVRGNYKPLKGTNLTVAARRHPFISPAW